MSILVDKKSRVVVQGITGGEGTFHAQQMIAYGTKVVAGVTPGKGGTEHIGVPVFNTVREAVDVAKANVACIFVPPAFAGEAIMEAADAGVAVIVCITEGIPTKDMIRAFDFVKSRGVRLIGPNCPGIISPGQAKVGIMPGFIHMKGNVGVISRSGTLTYEAVKQLTDIGIGQSTCIGIGGDPIIGTQFIDALRLFNDDPDTDAVVMIGEIGGTAEEEGAAFVKKHMTKPVVGFIAGRTAPPGRRMGHAGAIIAGGKGTAAEKMAAMKKAGIHVVESPALIGITVAKALKLEEHGQSKPKHAKAAQKAEKKADQKKAKAEKKADKKLAAKPVKKAEPKKAKPVKKAEPKKAKAVKKVEPKKAKPVKKAEPKKAKPVKKAEPKKVKAVKKASAKKKS
ncbi:MAG: succinate--CoA ligase subunit alpha [Ignavibacteria bacterium]|nr:succinate--CoA ligase subunit alpha [Ignavibacteria bacterium]